MARLKLDLDIDTPGCYLYSGELCEALSAIGRMIEDCEETTTPRTEIKDKRGSVVGWWEVK